MRCWRTNRHHIPFLQTANYYCVSATLSRDPHHPLGHLVGDLLVRYPSATGQGARGERIPFELDSGHHHAGGLTHFHVLNDAEVYRQIHAWLERRQSRSGPANTPRPGLRGRDRRHPRGVNGPRS